MVVKYLLITCAEELRTSGQYVPRVGESVRLCNGVRGVGVYKVAEVINWVKQRKGPGDPSILEAGLPRVMLRGDEGE